MPVWQVCCSKTLVAKLEHKETVHQLCKEVTEFSTARMKERSSGIQEFNCMVDGWEDNVVHFWERYESNVALGRHNTTAEVEAFMKKVRGPVSSAHSPHVTDTKTNTSQHWFAWGFPLRLPLP
jgi:quinol monooxygenase YgiN